MIEEDPLVLLEVLSVGWWKRIRYVMWSENRKRGEQEEKCSENSLSFLLYSIVQSLKQVSLSVSSFRLIHVSMVQKEKNPSFFMSKWRECLEKWKAWIINVVNKGCESESRVHCWRREKGAFELPFQVLDKSASFPTIISGSIHFHSLQLLQGDWGMECFWQKWAEPRSKVTGPFLQIWTCIKCHGEKSYPARIINILIMSRVVSVTHLAFQGFIAN